MSIELAIHLSEMLVAFAIALQCFEHLYLKIDQMWVYLLKLALCILLVFGFSAGFCNLGLLILGVYSLKMYEGPYNGGSDRMTLLVLLCLSIARLAPEGKIKTLAIGYLGAQTLLSYFVAGLSKCKNFDWLKAHVLKDILLKSNYPISDSVRSFGYQVGILRVAAFLTLLFELTFPLALINFQLLMAFLVLGFLFHLANSIVLGLNRFTWAWLSSYPALIWLQSEFSFIF